MKANDDTRSTTPPAADAVEAVKRFIADYDDGDRADAGNGPLMEAHVADFRAAISAYERALSQPSGIERLVEAARPFADFAKRIPDSSPNAMCIRPSWSLDDLPMATALDFRRLASALSSLKESGR